MSETRHVGRRNVPGVKGNGPKNAKGVLKRLLAFIFKNYLPHCILVLVFIIAAALAQVRGTLFLQTLIDDYITPMIGSPDPDFGPLAAALLQIVGVYAFGILCSFLFTRVMVNVSQGTLRNLRVELFSRMERLPIRYFDTHAHGDIMSIYTNDTDTLRQFISQSLPQICSCGVTVLSIFCSMVILDIPLTLLTLAMICVSLLVTRKIAGKSGKYFAEQQKNLGIVNGYIEEMMDGQKVVKVFCHEDETLGKFRELNENLRESAKQANTFANILMPANVQIGNLSYVLCAVVGATLAINGYVGLTLGTLVSFLTLNKSFTQPISQISQQLNSVVMALAGAERVFTLLDEEPETDEGYVTLVNVKEQADGSLVECEERTCRWAWKHPHSDGTVTYTRLTGDVVFNDVDFGYTPDKIVLQYQAVCYAGTESGLCRQYRSRKDNHYKSDQPVLRYSRRKDSL